MRSYTEYADRLYLDPIGPAHIVPWDTVKTALCGLSAQDFEWWGTGDWNETEHAAWLPLCSECARCVGLDPAPPASTDPAVVAWRGSLTSP